MNPHPARRRIVTLSLFSVGVVILIAIGLTQRPPDEPQLNGKPLSHYLDLQTYGELRTERDARESISDFGSNAVPHLIRILEYRPTRLDSLLESTASRIPFFRFSRTPFQLRQLHAILACSSLGPKAAAAVPALSNLVNDPLLGEQVVLTLANLGSNAFPTLTNALATGVPPTRAAAALVLRSITFPPSDAIMPLLRALNDSSFLVRVNAASSLALVAPDHQETLSALTNLMHHRLLSVRISAIHALGWMKAKAAPAEPQLRELLRNEEDLAIQHIIEQVLEDITSQQIPLP